MFRQGARYIEIENGARVCKLLKKYYFEDQEWVDCRKRIGAMFTTTKLLAKNLYKDMDKKDIIDLLVKYNKQDFEDLLSQDAVMAEHTGNSG